MDRAPVRLQGPRNRGAKGAGAVSAWAAAWVGASWILPAESVPVQPVLSEMARRLAGKLALNRVHARRTGHCARTLHPFPDRPTRRTRGFPFPPLRLGSIQTALFQS